ncbi:hypothetical protein DICVIV_00532 [Dictyocaulus viviparus]|uniref:Uncharacterized protein n=1 Tax=Dictyocaulus viviparus TaxID=29172 RepID=A0A0D8YF15_DICVI|nr:hypothetical protein DICVIV_00532 [Dictyocaulus viviparus]
MSNTLPTTPIGKQQMIDMRAGAILRDHARSLLMKQGFIFDSQPKFYRRKRESFIATLLDVPTTMITMTNTQMFPVEGDTLRMKTIRNRMKPISDMVRVDNDNNSADIDSDEPPRVFITKIISRREEINENKKKLTEKQKKRKGKGNKRKKLKQTTNIPLTQNATTKKRKGNKRKQKKTMLGRNPTDVNDQTKSPRHLLSSPGLPHRTTPRPHQSSFLHGVIDPEDLNFSNKGQIRGYKMHIASRKPKPFTRSYNETRVPEEVDEFNNTTHTTDITTTSTAILRDVPDEDISSVNDIPHVIPSTEQLSTTPTGLKDSFHTTHVLKSWKATTTPPSTTVPISSAQVPFVANTNWVSEGVQTEEEKRLEAGYIMKEQNYREISTLEQLNNDQSKQTLSETSTTARSRVVKHGFERSYDNVDTDVFNKPKENVNHVEQKDTDNDFHFHLSTFSSSATCIARTMFDLWCASQLLTLFPCLIGVCAAYRSLFVSHLVLDILLLVVGFIYTITMIVFSMVLYILIGDMPKEVLFEWILFALLLDGFLLLYGCLVVVSLRCCERIVQSRLSTKLKTPSSKTEAHEAQPV